MRLSRAFEPGTSGPKFKCRLPGFLVWFGFEKASHVAQVGLDNVAEDSLEFLILPPPFVKCWDYRRAAPYLVFTVLRMEPRPSRTQASTLLSSTAPAFHRVLNPMQATSHALGR